MIPPRSCNALLWAVLSLLLLTLQQAHAQEEELPIVVTAPEPGVVVKGGDSVIVNWILNDATMTDDEMVLSLELFPDGNPNSGDPTLTFGSVVIGDLTKELTIPEDTEPGTYGIRAEFGEKLYFSSMFSVAGPDGTVVGVVKSEASQKTSTSATIATQTITPISFVPSRVTSAPPRPTFTRTATTTTTTDSGVTQISAKSNLILSLVFYLFAAVI
ncbi:hypothetical protein HDU97_000737 [Phlyctochytrium planicorne]|nr:hypothetical protein HDU97_000737 [Phlyctochytrium planicorne]